MLNSRTTMTRYSARSSILEQPVLMILTSKVMLEVRSQIPLFTEFQQFRWNGQVDCSTGSPGSRTLGQVWPARQRYVPRFAKATKRNLTMSRWRDSHEACTPNPPQTCSG